jgi:hypothetical protein
VCSGAVLLAACQPAAAVPPGGGVPVTIPGGIAHLAVGSCALPGQAVVRTRSGRYLQLKKRGREIHLKAIGTCPAEAPGEPGVVEGSAVGRGSLTINKAWLGGATRRYGHAIMGDTDEAGELHVTTPSGGPHRFTLAADSVFEDLLPRVVDIEGDGQEEVLLVRSRLSAGSSVALLAVENGQLRLVAESKPIGRRNRWLNPVGVADFDGDGRREIAVVLTPHIGGTLTLYERRGNRLVVDHRRSGFSNHAIGSRELGMSAVLDFNGDRVPNLAVPGSRRRSLRIVTFAGGRFVELYHRRYGAEIVTGVIKANFDTQNQPDLVFGLRGGTLVVLMR